MEVCSENDFNDLSSSAYLYISKLGMSNGMITLQLLLFLIVALVLYVYFSFYKYSDKFMEMANKIPGPRCFPVVGSAYLFGTNPKDILQNVTDFTVKFGVVSAHWVGPMLYVCLSKSCDVEMVLSNSNLLTKSKANQMMKSGVGEGILISTGERWKKHRKLLQPTFHYHVLEDYIRVFINKSEILNDLLDSQVEKPEFNICPFTNNFAYDILCETLMATKSDEQLSGKQAQFVTSLTTCLNILICRFFKPWLYVDSLFFKTASGKEYKENMDFVHQTTGQKVLHHMEKMKSEGIKEANGIKDDSDKKKTKSFIQYLLEVAPENALTEQDILDESYTIMMAGFDTTSAALGFLCFVLSKRFDIQEKLVEEIKEVLGTMEEKPFTYQDIQSFKYLDRVVNETLRVLPTIPYVARQVTEDIKLPSGYTMPTGCGVIVPFIRFHRDPEQYPDPHVFDPDNFLPERIAERHPYSFCPFSAGPRNCIGKRFAMVQLKTFVVCLMRRFWLIPTDHKLELASKISMISRNGVNIGVKRRTVERPLVADYENLSKRIDTNMDFMNIRFKDSYL